MIDFLKVLADPIGTAVELGGGVLGLPPSITNPVKLIGGLATGNVVMAFNGAVGMATTLLGGEGKPGQPEYKPSKDAHVASAGYAPALAPESRKRLEEYRDALETIRDNMGELDKALGWPIDDGLVSRDDLTVVANNPKVSAELRSAVQYLLRNRDDLYAIDNAARIGLPDGLFGLADVETTLYEVQRMLGGAAKAKAPKTPKAPKAPKATKEPKRTKPSKPAPKTKAPKSSSPPKTGSTAQPKPGQGTGLDPNLAEYRVALEALRDYWDLFDSRVGKRDDRVSKENLEALVKTPAAHWELKLAAHFLLDHPEYYGRLDTAGSSGASDGVIALSEVEAELKRVGKRDPVSGLFRQQASTAMPPPGMPSLRHVRDIVEDPTLSLEERIQLILMSVTETLDDAIEETMSDLADAQDRSASIRDEGSDKEGAHQAEATANRSIEQLQLKLQKLMERRRQMFDLTSNMSEKFNEMAKTAIQNMARA